MKPVFEGILRAAEGKRADKSPLLFENYKRQIDRAIATDREKKIARLELCRVMGCGAGGARQAGK